MTRGGKAALLTVTFTLAGCTTASNQLKIRAVADPISSLRKGDDLAVARGQLALNNVGLALEAFRKAQREQPTNPVALVGIADCYSVMGRFDLAQLNLEAALALAPRNSDLLMRLARVLDLEGQPYRAAMARRDARAAVAVAASRPIDAAPRLVPTASVTIALPPARAANSASTVQLSSSATIAPATAPAPVAPVVAKPVAIAPNIVTMLAGTELAGLLPSVTAPVSAPLADPQVAAEQPKEPVGQVTPARPAPRSTLPVAPARIAATTPTLDRTAQLTALFAHSERPEPPLAPPRQSAPRNEAVAENASGPRLERLSPHEVALVTTTRSAATNARVSGAALSSAVRWMPLAGNASRPVVQILNAARTDRLAASARSVLTNRGWRKVGIGNAPTVRQASVIYYPLSRAKLARSLASQFGIRTHLIAGSSVVVVLGLDKVRTIRALR